MINHQNLHLLLKCQLILFQNAQNILEYLCRLLYFVNLKQKDRGIETNKTITGAGIFFATLFFNIGHPKTINKLTKPISIAVTFG